MATDLTTPVRAKARPRLLRRVLLVIVGTGLALLLALAGVVGVVYLRAGTSTVGKLDFANQLEIPPLLTPRTDATGTKVFDLRLQPGTSQLLPGNPTPTWGANGAYLGPTLRASRGDKIRINVRNDLPRATTLHWHGMHLPARDDGGPHQMIDPGATWSPSWRIDQPAATLWYHPHPHGQTADHVYRGVAGLFLLDDPQAAALALPHRYGVDDIPLIIQDKAFRRDGKLDSAKLGGQILINGTYNPHVEIGTRLVRLRLLNASVARSYDIGFADNRPFDLIGTDGGLLDRPYRLTRVPLSPGERAEIVAAFAPGEQPVLRSFQPDLGENGFGARFNGGDDTFDLLQFRSATRLAGARTVPARLAHHEQPDAAHARTRSIAITSSRSIDGKSMDMGRIDQVVNLGATEIWEVRNRTGELHNFHVHDIQFKLLEYKGGSPPPHLSGWKDTVAIPPGQSVRFITRFTDYADPSTPYMFHCHLLRHEDSGLMGQFVVVRPGQTAGQPPVHHHHG
jgi:FtsP/CotA-like multicopper oxidase with cupredoxin domain